MTMKERITASVTDQLKMAADGIRKDEVVEELSANLFAKYEDLVRAGVDAEEAFGLAMDGLGDVSELVDLCGGPKYKADFDAAMGSISDMGRQAVDEVKGVWHDMKEPLKDLCRTVRDAVKSLEITVTAQDRHQFDYTVPADDITGLEFRVQSGDVVLRAWDQDVIQVIERSARELDENKHAVFFRREDGVLCVEQGATAAGLASFRFGLFSSDFEVFLPRRLWRTVTLLSTNGDVTFQDPAEIGVLTVQSTNGDVALGEGALCDTVSITTVSGDVSARALSVRVLTCKATSGDLDLGLAALPESMDLKTVSGQIDLLLPDNGGFAVAYEQMSGYFNARFEMTTSLDRRTGIASYKGAQAPLYRVSTMSGNIDLYLG